MALRLRKRYWIAIVCFVLVGWGGWQAFANNPWQKLGEQAGPLLACLRGEHTRYELTIEVEAQIEGKATPITVQLTRWNTDDYDFRATHPEYAAWLKRRADQTVFSLPLHQVEYVGAGPVPAQDHLTPDAAFTQLVDADSQLATWLPMLQASPQTLALLLSPLKKLAYLAEENQWSYGPDFTLQVMKTAGETPSAVTSRRELTPQVWQMAGKDWKATLRLQLPEADVTEPVNSEWRQVLLERDELERQLSRGVRRALAVLAPSAQLTKPKPQPQQVDNGELRWVQGERVVYLFGTPQEMGQAHARLLRQEAIRCMDSVLYAFGTVETIRSGRWFRHELEAAFARLEPHIPAEHLEEMAALGTELGWDPQLVKTLNVFPELFHCSGFALFDSATADGVLYHGRVLDYMTMIGLQDAAATFIQAPAGKYAFANVGYGGFVGSVSGMNNQGISLGEMGGRGEGQWDGVPMATLMRRALEECQTLEQVMELWSTSPRTCEYYYVFAEAKPGVRKAVGVAATPEKIEFIHPGEAHPLLGPGIPDTVVLSAGKRLETLRNRVLEKHGKVTAEEALWFMSRPVAMQSNLHNVLFVPEQGILYVANADHQKPAADRRYVKLDLTQALEELNARINSQ